VGILGANTKFGYWLGTVIDRLTNETVTEVSFFASTAIPWNLILTSRMRRTGLGGSSRLKAFVDIHTSKSISLVTILAKTLNTRIFRGTNGISVARSIFDGHIEAIVGKTVYLHTIRSTHITISVVALITGTSNAGEQRGTCGVRRTISVRCIMIQTMISGFTSLSITSPSTITDTPVPTYGVGTHSMRTTNSGGCMTLIHVITGLTITKKTIVANTSNAWPSRNTSSVRRASSKFG